MARQAIRRESEKAEARFRELTGARKSDNQRKGDAILTVGGKDHYIEIKECHADAGESGTLNQIRAVKFIPLVVYNPVRGKWYVASPIKIARLTTEKERGQHNEIAYECANLSLSQLESDACDDKDLKSRVEEACRQAEAHGELRKAMSELLQELRDLAERYRQRIRELLPAK